MQDRMVIDMGFLNMFGKEPSLEEGIKAQQETKGSVLLDVRSEGDYAEGHLEGSVNIPLNKLAGIDLPKETPLFVYCLSGARAGRAVTFLTKMGYKAVNIGGVSGHESKLVR